MRTWNPPTALTRKEELLMKRLRRTRKLFSFLRLSRTALFSASFQEELSSMYRRTGAGDPAVPPAMLCMVLILQAYLRISDAEAVELSVVDARWQMVLDCMGAESPPFSQGALQMFRERLILADMDRRLLERTIELARQTREFDWKKLPKDLRIAVDSRPLEGAGRVEDTFNLLGHAARKLVELASWMLGESYEAIASSAGIPVLLSSSVKAGLDINWSDPDEKDGALEKLVGQVASLVDWLNRKQLLLEAPLRPYLDAMVQVQKQDLERDTNGRVHIRRGVASDRRVSIEDADMRHGRKSKSKRFNGYKQHIAVDLDTGLITAGAVTPANRPEEEATPQLKKDIDRQSRRVDELSIDRAYVNSSLADDVIADKGEVIAKPWSFRNKELFVKTDFHINLTQQTITCPAGQTESFEPGHTVHFDPEVCGCCPLRSQCTSSASGGRTVRIAEDERLQKRLRKLQATSTGRERLRERTRVEHSLAHLGARQGPRARYRGTRKNLFDLRRVAAVQNLETIQRVEAAAKLAA